MSLHWTLIAGLLYVEIAVALLMMLPFISAFRWRKIIKSRFLQSIGSQSTVIFYGGLILLIMAFLDSINKIRKYSNESSMDHSEHAHLDVRMEMHIKLVRAQRNLYISGFTLLLFLIIKKMASLLSTQATLLASNEASMKQAQAATDVASKLLDEKEQFKKGSSDKKDNSTNDELETKNKEMAMLREELEKTKDALKRANVDKEAMRNQAQSVTGEYDRLLNETRKLQETINALEGKTEVKKDD